MKVVIQITNKQQKNKPLHSRFTHRGGISILKQVGANMFKKFDGEISHKLEQYEKDTNMKLPADYKQFLMRTNGGQFINEIYTFWVEKLEMNIGVDVLFGFNSSRSLCLTTWYKEYVDELPENAIIIGNSINAGLILLIWQIDWKGVFLWDLSLDLEQSTEENCLYRIADNFNQFYSSLKKQN